VGADEPAEGDPVEGNLGAFPGEKLDQAGWVAEAKLVYLDAQRFRGQEVAQFMNEDKQSERNDELNDNPSNIHKMFTLLQYLFTHMG